MSTSFRTRDNKNVEARLEGDAVRGIEYAHVAVHDDAFCIVSDYENDLDIATPKTYVMIAPATHELHVLFDVNSSAPVIIELFKGAEVAEDGEGTKILHFRPNMWSKKSIDTSYHTPTLTEAGTLVWKVQTGGVSAQSANQRVGGGTRAGEEIIIPGGEALVMKVTATVNDTILTVVGEYYEVPDGFTEP